MNAEKFAPRSPGDRFLGDLIMDAEIRGAPYSVPALEQLALKACHFFGVDPQQGVTADAGLTLLRPRDWAGRTPPRRALVVGEWVAVGTVIGLGGAGGFGKSLLVQQLSTCVAAGSPFMGIPVQQGPVLALFTEDDPSELARRQNAINVALMLTGKELDDLHYISRPSDENLLMTFNGRDQGTLTPLWAQLREMVMDLRPVLVELDTAADLFGGNENDRSHVTQFIKRAVGGLIQGLDTAALFTAHTPKHGGVGYSGSTAWQNATRSQWWLRSPAQEETTKDGPSEDDGRRVLERTKSSGVTLEMQYSDGAFVSRGGGGADTGAGARCEAAFIEMLRGRIRDQTWVSANERGNYAPRVFVQLQRRMRRAEKYTVREFETAMDRLLEAGQIAHRPRSGSKPNRLVIDPGTYGVPADGTDLN